MATGGRVLHHLAHRLPDPGTTVLFVGYQAEGTRGRRLLDGEPTLRMFGEDVPVRADDMAVTSEVCPAAGKGPRPASLPPCTGSRTRD